MSSFVVDAGTILVVYDEWLQRAFVGLATSRLAFSLRQKSVKRNRELGR